MKYFIFLSVLFACSCKGRVYRASGSSMEETIKPGEPFYVKATSRFERNDIAVFDFYGNDYSGSRDENGQFRQHWEKRIFRIIAMSGDVLEIKKDTVYLNGVPRPFPPGSKLPYRLFSRQLLEDEFVNQLNLMPYDSLLRDTFLYTGALSADQLGELKSQHPEIIKAVRIPFLYAGPADTAYARTSAEDHWNTSDYGPLKIPSPGDVITVSPENYKLYHNIPGIRPGENRLKEKLYFVMGDNRHGAEDSRFIGLIPASNMYGIIK